MKSKVFLGNRKERLKLYKTKKGWVLAKKTAIVLGTTTAIGLSLAVNVNADNIDTPTSDSTVVATTNTDDKKEVTNKNETSTPTTATSELSNANKNTSDSTSNIANETSDATSNVAKDSTSEANTTSETNSASETVSASSNYATASDTNNSNQVIANTVPAKAKLATTSLMETSEPTTTSSPTVTEAQPTLTTAQTDNTQVKPVTSWTSTNGDYHVELNKNQISAENNGLEIKISGTSKAGDKLYLTPLKVDNNYKDIYTKVGIDTNQSEKAYTDSVRASIRTTDLSGNGTTSFANSYRDDFSGSATFEQNWILTGWGLSKYAPNNQTGFLLRQNLMEATGTKNVLTPVFLEYYDSATKQWERTVLTYNSLIKNVQPTATLAPVVKNNRGELITDPNKAESNLSAFSSEPFVINIEPNARLVSNIDGKGVDGNYIKETTYTIPVPDDFKLDVDASFKTSKDDNLSFSQTGNVITVKLNAKADATLYKTVPNITLVGYIADDKYQGIKQAQAPISISETLINDEVITKEAGTITYQKNNSKNLGGLPVYHSYDNDNSPGRAGNIMLDNLATQPATQVGSHGFGNTSGITLNRVGFTSVVADGFNVTNIRAFLYSNENLKGTATGNYTIHYVDGTTKTGSIQLSTEEKKLVDDGTKQIASIEWSIDGLGNLINFSNDLMGNLAHNYRDGSLVKVGDTLKNHYKLYGQYSNNNNGVTNTTFYGGEFNQIENVVDSALRVRSGLWTYQSTQGAGNAKMGQISIYPGLNVSDSDVERVFEPIIYYVLDEGINVNKDVFWGFPQNVTKPKVSKFRLDNGQLVLKLDFTGTGNSFGIRDGIDSEYRLNLDIDADAVNGNYYGYGYIDLTNDIKKNPRHKGDKLIDPVLAEQLGANALTTINSGKDRYTVNSAQSAYQSNYVKANADNDLTNNGLAYTNQDKSMTYYVNGVNNTNNAIPLTMVVNFPQASADSFKFSLTGPIELDGYAVKYATELSDLSTTTPQEHFVEASGISDWSQVKSIELIKNEPLSVQQSTGRLAIHGLDNTLENDAGKTGVFSTVSYFGSLRSFKPEKVSIAVKYDPEYVKTLVDNDRKETPYKAIYQADDGLDVGQKVTKQTGIVDVVTSQTTYTISEDGRSLVPNTTTNHEVVGQDEIILVGVKPKVEKETTPFKTVYRENDNLDHGQQREAQKGKDTVKTTTTTYELNVETGEVTPHVNSETDEGQDRIVEIGVKPVVEKETTPFKTIYRENSALDHGQQQEVQKGKDTVKTTTTTYTLNVETGEVTPHADSQTDEGHDRIVEVGIKPVVEKETTPFKTVYRENSSLDHGQQQEVQKGKDTVKTTTTTYELNVETGEVTPHVDSETDEGQDRIVEVGIKPVVEKSTEPYKTIYQADDSLEVGQKVTKQSGKVTTTTKTTTYTLNVQTGEVTSKTDTQVDKGQDGIILVGIKPRVNKETTPFKTIYRENDNLDHGQQQEVQKGKDTVKTTTTTYELNVETGEVTPHVDSQTDNGQDRIIEVGIKPVVDKTTEPYKTIYQADDSLEAGQKATKQEGKVTTTTKTTTYTLNVETGEVTPTTDTQVDKGQDEIILVGIKPVVEKETTPFKTIYRENSNLDYGQQNEIQSGKNTVKTTTTTYELNVETGKVTPHVDSQTNEGQDRIVEVGIKPVVEKTTEPYKTIYQADDSLEAGQKVTKQEGKVTTTTKTTTYTLNAENGEVTPKTDAQVDKGQDEIILVGIKPVVEKETTPFKTVYRENSNLDHGQQQEIQSGKDTVKTTTTTYELNVETGEVTPHVDSQTDEGQDRIVEVGIKPVVEKETTSFKTIYRENSSLDHGQQQEVQKGKDTVKTTTTTYELDVETGEVTPHVNSETDEGQDRIVEVGVKPVVEKTTEPYKTIYQADDSLEASQKVTKQEGKVTTTTKTTTYALNVQTGEVTPTTDTQVDKGQNEIILVGIKPVVDKETTLFKTVYRENSNLDHGQQQEIQKGKDAVKTTTTTYELNVETGEVTPHVDSQTDEGQDRIVEVGIKPVVEKTTEPYKTIYQADDSLEAGRKVTKQEGEVTTTTKTTTYTLNVETGEVTPKTDTQTDKGQDEIILVGIKPVVEKETIPFKTVYRENNNLDHGQQQEVQKGKDTVKTTTTTYELNVETGETTPHVNSEIDEGQDRIIEVGIKPVVEKETTPFKTIYRENNNLGHGQQQEVQSGKNTVKTTTTTYELNVETGEVTPHVDSQTDEGQDRIVEIGVKPVVEKETTPFKTVYRENGNLDNGQQQEVQKGKDTVKTTTTTYELNVETGEVTPYVNSETDEGQDRIVEVGAKPVVEKETTPFKTIYRENDNLDHGQQQEVQKGKDTVKTTTTTYELNVETGKVTPRVNSETDEGQDRIVEVGAKPVIEKSTEPYKTIYQSYNSLEAGQKVTKQEGKVTTTIKTTTYTLNVETGEVTPKTDTQVDKGQDEIILVGIKPVVEKSTEPYKTIYQSDDSLEASQKVTKQEGKVTTTTKTTTYTLNVETGEVTPKTGTQVDKGQDEIILVGVKPKVNKGTTPFKTIYRENSSLDHGQQQEVQKGKDTVKTMTTTYELNVETGEVTPRVNSETDEGQDRIVEVGIKPVVEKTTEPYKTIYQADDSLKAGQKVTKQEGKVTTTTKTTTYMLNVEIGKVTPTTDIQVDKGQDKIVKVGIKPVVVQTETPYQTEYVEDKNLYEGQTKLIQPGKNTLVITTTTYTLLADGSVQANEPVENKTSGQNEIIAVGIKKVTGQKDNQAQTKVQDSTKEQLKVTNVTPKALFEQSKDLKVAQKAKTLPQTGIDETNLGILSLMFMSLVGFVSTLFKKRNH